MSKYIIFIFFLFFLMIFILFCSLSSLCIVVIAFIFVTTKNYFFNTKECFLLNRIIWKKNKSKTFIRVIKMLVYYFIRVINRLVHYFIRVINRLVYYFYLYGGDKVLPYIIDQNVLIVVYILTQTFDLLWCSIRFIRVIIFISLL